MGSERDTVFGNSIAGTVSGSEGELLFKLARGVPVGQVIVAHCFPPYSGNNSFLLA